MAREVKSMHTAEAARRRGIGRAMVDHLIGVARARGYRRVSLETGSMAAFDPARSLYADAGFESWTIRRLRPQSEQHVHDARPGVTLVPV